MSECCKDCDAREAEARAAGRIGPDDVPVTMTELQEIWNTARAEGRVCNGITGAVLAERYGDRLYHVTGVGWFIQRQAERLNGACDVCGRGRLVSMTLAEARAHAQAHAK